MNPDFDTPADDLQEMSLLEHLDDLRKYMFRGLVALIVLFPIGVLFAKDLIGKLTSMTKVPTLQAIMPAETFIEQFKVGLIIALFFGIPYLTYLAWNFVSPALYEKEKIWGRNVIVSSSLLFAAGALFAFFFILPSTLDFFYSQDIPGVEYKPRLTNVVGFAVQICGATGVMAQLPVVTVILYSLGIVSLEKIKSSRRYVLIAILVLAALLTPPDIFSQAAIGIPAYAIFEISLLLCSMIDKAKKGESIRSSIRLAILGLTLLLGGGAWLMIKGTEYLAKRKNLQIAAPVDDYSSIASYTKLGEDKEGELEVLKFIADQTAGSKLAKPACLGLIHHWTKLRPETKEAILRHAFVAEINATKTEKIWSIDASISNNFNIPTHFRVQWVIQVDDRQFPWPNQDNHYSYHHSLDHTPEKIQRLKVEESIPALKELLKETRALNIKTTFLALSATELDESPAVWLKTIESEPTLLNGINPVKNESAN